MYKLDKKRAVITGAASGLGRELALALAAKAWTLGLADFNLQGAADTLALVEQAGGRGDTFLVDTREPEQVAAMAAHFWDQRNGIDLLINNAGVAVAGTVGDVPIDEWRRVIDTNFLGMVYGCHEFIPRMKAQGGGYIVNVASAAGFTALPEMGPYNTSKAATLALSETLYSELAPHNIGVTVVCPFFFKTHLLDKATFTDDWEPVLAHAGVESSRMSAAEIAARTLAAVEKRKLYMLPQGHAKAMWAMKRFAPRIYHGNLAFANRAGFAKPVAMWLAKHGLL